MAVTLTNTPTLIEKGPLKFVILDAPSDSNLHLYMKEFQKHNVTHVVRVCQDTYNCKLLERNNIQFHDWPFDDGSAPPKNVLTSWLELVNQVFPLDRTTATEAIAVHCVAGLGRAPVLVAVALVERADMNALDAIQFIRGRRRGAINSNQMAFIEKYYKMRKKNKCIVM
ncbi:protein tyrosine phosphatase type IVA [Acrasis kona]|uniref:Protein tyrosine phosphatase PRL-1 n=1 Tax=Acrasis kona TaxID=1008807 RepID=A0AAW2ZPG0_9EUKA